MENKIRILPKSLADKIAAGEVVERPASVVKELVENALDAKSSSIEIKIENAGRKLIKISDDGEGMTADDLRLACHRHATSKIKNDLDLNSINTLGFRGEALASIAAVSLLNLCACAENSGLAWEIEIEGGCEKSLQQTTRTKGTTVEVRNLFFNVPARLKFLKADATEMFHIIRNVTELSLAYPQVSFKLFNKTEEIISVSGNTDLSERIKILLGEELSGQLYPIYTENPLLKISGFIAKTGFSQSNRNNQYIFVNKRCVKDRTIAHAIMQGYHTFLPQHQFPPAVVFIELPPELVDVNVHPAKREVRFREGFVIHDMLVKIIKQTLTDKEHLPYLMADKMEEVKDGFDIVNLYNPRKTGFPSADYMPAVEEKGQAALYGKDNLPGSLWQEEGKYLEDKPQLSSKHLQIRKSYIVSQHQDGIVIVDQHAAHERVIFDELLEQFNNKTLEKQRLLLPAALNLNKAEAVLMREHKELLQGLGFEVEEFGRESYVVHAYPVVLGKVDISNMFQNILIELSREEISADMDKKVTQFLAPIACHSAVRANENLSDEQIDSLLKRLWKTKCPFTCPHGRPTLITVSWVELEKKFKRK